MNALLKLKIAHFLISLVCFLSLGSYSIAEKSNNQYINSVSIVPYSESHIKLYSALTAGHFALASFRIESVRCASKWKLQLPQSYPSKNKIEILLATLVKPGRLPHSKPDIQYSYNIDIQGATHLISFKMLPVKPVSAFVRNGILRM